MDTWDCTPRFLLIRMRFVCDQRHNATPTKLLLMCSMVRSMLRLLPHGDAGPSRMPGNGSGHGAHRSAGDAAGRVRTNFHDYTFEGVRGEWGCCHVRRLESTLASVSIMTRHPRPRGICRLHLRSSCAASWRASHRRWCTEGIDRTCSKSCFGTQAACSAALFTLNLYRSVVVCHWCHWYPAANSPSKVGDLHVCTALSTLAITIDNRSAWLRCG